MRCGSGRCGVGNRLRAESLRLLVLVIAEGVGILIRVVYWSGSRLSTGLVVGVVVFLPVGSVIVSSGGLVLRLRLVIGLRWRLVLGLRLVLRLWSHWHRGAGRSWEMVARSLETVLSSRVSYSPPLSAVI